jgi:hypothetical protein
LSTVQEYINGKAGVTLDARQSIWALRYLAALTDPDMDSHLRHKARVYKEWRGPGRKVVFQWADNLVYPMSSQDRAALREHVFSLLEQMLPA